MSLDIETIYALLPAVYRTRDAAVAESQDDLLTPSEQVRFRNLRDLLGAGAALTPLQQRDLVALEEKRLRGPLKALLTVIAEQVAGLEENIEQLYDDQFIETCAEWVVPYIADLIGYRQLDPRLQRLLRSTRAEVANTIRLRRRKGTAAVLEELALDITRWDAVVVECFLRLATTQYMNHIRSDHRGMPDLRRVAELELVGGPFDPLLHTADVRRIASGRGRYNIPNVAIFLWRIGSHKLTASPAFKLDARRYLFSPLGANTQLYNAAERDPNVPQLAHPLDVPLPITRRMLRAQLEQLYGLSKSLSIAVDGQVLGLDLIEACDLSDAGPDPQTSAWTHPAQTKVAVDPVLGRIAFPADEERPVTVSFSYGFTAAIGGGMYERAISAEPPSTTVRVVPRDHSGIAPALKDLRVSSTNDPDAAGVVEIAGNGRYEEALLLIAAANQRLVLRSAVRSRPLIQVDGDLVIGGGDSSEVTLSGLLIAGGRVVVPTTVNERPNRLQKLRIEHCTLVPGGGLTRDGQPEQLPMSLVVEASNVTVTIERCIVGALHVTDESTVTITHSIVDALSSANVAYAAPDSGGAGGPLTIESCTIIGKVHTALLTASNSIFHAALAMGDTWRATVIADRRQIGYARYCYVPPDAQTPPRYACQPQNQLQALQVVPRFTSLRYGHPGYCQLHAGCPYQIQRGAADEGEMGAFHDLLAPLREDALRVRLDEYLRFGLEAGLFFAS